MGGGRGWAQVPLLQGSKALSCLCHCALRVPEPAPFPPSLPPRASHSLATTLTCAHTFVNTFTLSPYPTGATRVSCRGADTST